MTDRIIQTVTSEGMAVCQMVEQQIELVKDGREHCGIWKCAAFLLEDKLDQSKEELIAARQSHAETVARLKVFESWIAHRIDWLKREMDNGGSFEHLNARRMESIYLQEKIAALAAEQKEKT